MNEVNLIYRMGKKKNRITNCRYGRREGNTMDVNKGTKRKSSKLHEMNEKEKQNEETTYRDLLRHRYALALFILIKQKCDVSDHSSRV
jgi:hypothetical protein